MPRTKTEVIAALNNRKSVVGVRLYDVEDHTMITLGNYSNEYARTLRFEFDRYIYGKTQGGTGVAQTEHIIAEINNGHLMIVRK